MEALININKENISKKIFKYKLEIVDEQMLVLPKGATILTIQSINNIPYIWALIDLKMKETENRYILMFGTGQLINDIKIKYINTFQVLNGDGVFHVFEELV